MGLIRDAHSTSFRVKNFFSFFGDIRVIREFKQGPNWEDTDTEENDYPDGERPW